MKSATQMVLVYLGTYRYAYLASQSFKSSMPSHSLNIIFPQHQRPPSAAANQPTSLKQVTWMRQLTSTVSQIPCPTRPAVNPLHIKIARAEEIPGSFRVDTSIIAVEYPAPTASDLGGRIESRVCEIGVPLLGDECGIAGVGGGRGEWEHMDAFNVFGICAEVGRVVDLVLEQLETMSMIAAEAEQCAMETYDARCPIGNEIGRLVGIVGPHEEIIVDRPG